MVTMQYRIILYPLGLNMDLFYFEIDNGDMSAIEDMDHGGGIAWASGDPLLAP